MTMATRATVDPGAYLHMHGSKQTTVEETKRGMF
jgi:hypothetical protein